MILNDKEIQKLINGDILEAIAQQKGVSINEARVIFASMSFSEYLALTENVVPPSGQPVGNGTPNKPNAGAENDGNDDNDDNANGAKMWSNPNAPIAAGMTVGIQGDGGAVIPMQVSQVDQNAAGVKVKDPTTGKEQWYNKDQLSTFGITTEGEESEETDTTDLDRLRELAGLGEMASAGASCAGAIATAPTPVGKVRTRSEESARLKSEHKRDTPYETIIGDTKPAQASGQLSANLAASGKPTARRAPR